MSILIFSIAFSRFVLAGQCVAPGTAGTGVQVADLRLDQGNGPMVDVPVQAQGDLSTCYANAASQMTQAYHQKKYNRPYRHCAVAMAADSVRWGSKKTGHDRQKQQTALENGYVCDVINASNKYGYCGSCDPLYSAMKSVEQKKYFDTMYKIYEKYKHHSARRLYDKMADEYNSFIFLTNFSRDPDMISPNNPCPPRNQLPDVEFPSYDAVKKLLSQVTPGSFFQAILLNSCNPRDPASTESNAPANPSCTALKAPLRRDTVRGHLRGYFTDNQKMPLSINYCANMFAAEADQSDFLHSDGSMISTRPKQEDRVKIFSQQLEKRVLTPLQSYIEGLASNPIVTTAVSGNGAEQERQRQLKEQFEKVLEYARAIQKCLKLAKTGFDSNNPKYTSIITTANSFSGGDGSGSPYGTLLDQIKESGNTDNAELTACTSDVQVAFGSGLPNLDIATKLNNMVLEGKMTATGPRMDVALQAAWTQVKDCAWHESLLIGQRCSNGKLQYLLRNSWGKSCSQYTNADTACDHVGGGTTGPATGNVWVDEEMLMRSVVEITSIPSP
ncbi:MAG: hypothetical protein A2X86_11920 [Bdellovibrionales bacterium GWA2_49_15]|nr:MAG: hypothetical protein A2X86_11920 [Bdellovibrionales bacterium GWA2_49_15]HAZ12541.1 hypothetical protein [Bdellovibrionales bacterium]